VSHPGAAAFVDSAARAPTLSHKSSNTPAHRSRLMLELMSHSSCLPAFNKTAPERSKK
jgi:hypothetical protein